MGKRWLIKGIIIACALLLQPALVWAAEHGAPKPSHEATQATNPLAKPRPKREPVQSMEFPWTGDVSAAVFTRGNILWVIFDQSKAFDIASIIKTSGSIVQHADPIENRYYTIIRFELDRPREVYVQKFGLKWIILFSKNAKRAFDPIQVETRTAPPAVPHIYVGVNQVNIKPVRITDPVVGDEMLVIPLGRQNFGIEESRRYIDFEMMKTSQGVALQLFTDEVKLFPMQSSINITSPSMELAARAPVDLAIKPLELVKNLSPTLLPFDEWAKNDTVTFSDDIASLEQAILDSAPESRSVQRLKLAKFYLAQRFAAEARGMFDNIDQTDPTMVQAPDIVLARGVAAFVMRRYFEAQKFFASVPQLPDAAQQEEVDFWNLAVKAKMDEKAKIAPFYLQDKDTFVSRYPLWLRQDLALTAAEQHIRSDDLSVAEQTLKTLNDLNSDGKITNDITYLRGLYAAQHGQADKAISLWDGLTKDVLDRYNRTRAQMSLVELLFSNGKIDLNEAITRLNTIRNSWRGDELERGILKILGQLYINSGNYIEGLRVWRQIVTNFPNTADALYVSTKMTQTFIYLFNQGGADNMTPLNALSLYYEFNTLTPIGVQRDMMVQNIANRLFQVDLLDQAAILLTHQVRYRLKGEEKIKLGTKLAMLHLWNKKPDLALQVLDLLGQEGEFTDVGIRREYIKAQGLSDLGRYEEALKVLENDGSGDANTIKAEVYWKMERWDRVAILLMPEFRRLVYKDRALTPPETNDLLRLATVYTLQKKKYALYHLYEDFKDRIPPEQKASKDIFDFLAADLDALDYKDVAGTMKLGSYKGFLEKYRTYAKDNGLQVLDAPLPAEGEATQANVAVPAQDAKPAIAN